MTDSDPITGEQALLDLEEREAQLRTIGNAAELVEALRLRLAHEKRQVEATKEALQNAEWNVVALARGIADRNRRGKKR